MAAAAIFMRSYEDFEPFCKWHRERGHDILEVHLQGFRKEQLRVQLNSLGIIIITGERPLEENKWSRFSKEIKASKNCKVNEIHAKLSGGILYIVMPKRQAATSIHQAPTTSPSKYQENGPTNAKINQNNAGKDSTTKGLDALENTKYDHDAVLSTKARSNRVQVINDLISRVKISRNTTLKAAVAVFVVVAVLGSFIMYKHR
ncbi:hypothetical protein Tsubulata_012790 [Turnera subulata]|uniref:SHSP domain-containing protein n=1 Tax=Turnera subulata TaxID=218843 RepID=A0A9Q0FRY9_9ROSI|nr:hypothetical protein Tsubulata_012790 [Turnera subulata]